MWISKVAARRLHESSAEPDHWTERGRAASVSNSNVTDRSRRSVPALGQHMRISTTVRTIAEAIAARMPTMSPSQQARVYVLCSMPTYTDLGAWEEAYGQPPSDEPETPLDLLLDSVFEFGRYNMYCRFDPAGTKRVYSELFEQLHRAGIDCPEVGDFTDF